MLTTRPPSCGCILGLGGLNRVSLIIKWLSHTLVQVQRTLAPFVRSGPWLSCRVIAFSATIVVLGRLCIVDYLNRVNVWRKLGRFHIEMLLLLVFVALQYLKSIDICYFEICFDLLDGWTEARIVLIWSADWVLIVVYGIGLSLFWHVENVIWVLVLRWLCLRLSLLKT